MGLDYGFAREMFYALCGVVLGLVLEARCLLIGFFGEGFIVKKG